MWALQSLTQQEEIQNKFFMKKEALNFFDNVDDKGKKFFCTKLV